MAKQFNITNVIDGISDQLEFVKFNMITDDVRNQATNIITNFLGDKVRAYKVICDDTNNSPYSHYVGELNIRVSIGIGGTQPDASDASWTIHNFTVRQINE